MNIWLLQTIWLGAAFALQYFVLPFWGLGAYTPDLLLAACGVLSAFFGPGRTLVFAFVGGLALDLLLGYGYGMYLLPLAAAAFLGQYLQGLCFERPHFAAALLGLGAFAAKVYRMLFAAGAGHGGLPAGADWAQGAMMALLTALCAWIMVQLMDRRQRRDKSGRYGSPWIK